ncbi:unnamed protein product [Prunus armeniaca]|uniref:Reverse transcriptase domain-containing protein n=1 Tax=Prunus armeniaca TaxID=36596 RepID=A0A6J5TMC0_PRUAR|nr:hypothetical protein GBA52_003290 [Prunus armeniaca]CAB4264155.1 unnamed protein product [Prunus armeniaca]
MDVANIMDVVETKITSEMDARLTRPFDLSEISHALSQMRPLKAPGSDGLPALFFQKYWDIIGEDIAFVCLQILNNGKSIKEFKHTLAALIPKIKNAKNVKDFQPISLYNVIYKIVAKTLANHLKIILPDNVINNATLAFELMHSVKT